MEAKEQLNQMETKLNLNTETLEALQELIEINIDSAKGLREAADAIDHDQLESLFLQISVSRDAQATELQHFLRMNDEEPEDDGSVAGAVHRKWLELRAAINSGDPKVVLIEAERGEDVIKGKYENLLKETAGSAMNDVLMRQYAEVKRQHDLVRDLRDSA